MIGYDDSDAGSGPAQPVVCPPTMRSFKCLQDCPASMVSISQTYPPSVDKAITIVVPLVSDRIQMRAEPQRGRCESMERGRSRFGICREIREEQRGSFQEMMVVAQTRVSSVVFGCSSSCGSRFQPTNSFCPCEQTMSLLAYIHRASNLNVRSVTPVRLIIEGLPPPKPLR